MVKSLKFSRTASAELQYKINASIIFNYLREKISVSRAEISKDLKISAPAVSRVIDELIKEGYVVETEKAKTKSGKKPTLLKINQKKGFVIGVDLGKEKLKVAFTALDGDVIKRYQGFKISNNRDIGEKLIIEIRNIMNKLEKESDLNKDTLKAICTGVPAYIDTESGRIMGATLYGRWKNLNFKEILGKEFGVPIFIENDVNLSALGEKHYGKGKKFNDLVFIEISTGIGVGVIIDNNLFRGSYGFAGEIGFTIINPDNLKLKTGNKGFLWKFTTVESIKKAAVREIKEGRKTLIMDMINGDIERIEPYVVCQAAIKEDKLANDIITNMINLLSIIIINLVLILNPQIIVIGGDICNLPEVDKLFLKPIMEIVKNSIPFKVPEISLSALGEDAGVIGSSFQAIESLMVSKFPYKIEEGAVS